MTIIELVYSIAIVLVLLAVISLSINVVENQKAARDVKRLSDLSTLDRAVNEYRIDNKNYPDTANVLRTSDQLPAGGTQLENASSGWINQNMSGYLSKMPTDPLNDETYHYSYLQNGSGYELNAKLEVKTAEMQNDGGNDPNTYEMGIILSLISP